MPRPPTARRLPAVGSTPRRSSPTWESRSKGWSRIAQYHMVAFALNSLGVELDEGLEPLPADAA
jgi:hypothetical protein